MTSSKFNYVIFPDRIYTLNYDGIQYKVSGEEIMAAFYREANLEQIFNSMENDTNENN